MASPFLALRHISFLVLGVDVGFEAIRDLITSDKPDSSIVGIVLNAVALLVMVPVAIAQRRTGQALDNEVLVAQSAETWLSNYLSVSLLVGLGLNAAFGLWWADPLRRSSSPGIAFNEGADACAIRRRGRTDDGTRRSPHSSGDAARQHARALARWLRVPTRRRRLGSDVFETRLILQPAICMTGADAARVFYEPDRLTRAKALPPTALTLLQDFVTATKGCEAGAPTCGRADEARSTGWSAWSTSLSDEAPGRATGSSRHSA